METIDSAAPHHGITVGLPSPAASAVSGVEDAAKHAIGALAIGKTAMDLAELPGRWDLPFREETPVDPMDFMTHATVDKMVRDAAVVGKTLTTDDVLSMISEDVFV